MAPRSKSPARKSPPARNSPPARKSPKPAPKSPKPAPKSPKPAPKSPKPAPKSPKAVTKSPKKDKPAPPPPAVEPVDSLATRRTPRKTSTPKRLGQDDDWGNSPAGKWESVTVEKRQEVEEKKITARAERIAEAEAKDAASDAISYSEIRKAYPVLSSQFEGATLTVLGDLIAELAVKQGQWDMRRTLVFLLWGAFVPLITGLYLSWLRSFTISKGSKLVDGASKAVLNQILLTPFMGLLFCFYYPFAMEGKLVVVSLDAFLVRYKTTVAFWLTADTINLSVVPPELQLLFGSSAAALWGVVNSLITP